MNVTEIININFDENDGDPILDITLGIDGARDDLERACDTEAFAESLKENLVGVIRQATVRGLEELQARAARAAASAQPPATSFVFKVVRVEDGHYASVSTPVNVKQYKLGATTTQPERNLPLTAFETLVDARKFHGGAKSQVILKCAYKEASVRPSWAREGIPHGTVFCEQLKPVQLIR